MQVAEYFEYTRCKISLEAENRRDQPVWRSVYANKCAKRTRSDVTTTN
jgi:hypothetical protein